MEGFQFITELVDRMSGPARAAASSLGHLAESAKRAEERVAHIGESVHKFAEAAAELWIVEKGAEFIGEAFKSIGEIGTEAVKFALEMGEFRENAVIAYESVEGTAEEGEKTFDQISELADTINMPVEKAHKAAADLMELGLENKEALAGVLTAMSDLERTGHERGAAKLQSVIERSLATGKFKIPDKALGSMGINSDAIAKALSEQMGIPMEAARAKIKAGAVDAEQGIAALTAAFQKSKIHDIAAKKFDMTDLVTRAQNSWKELFTAIDVTPVTSAFSSIMYVIDGAIGKGGGLRDSFVGAFDTIMRWLNPVIEIIEIFALKAEIAFLRAERQMAPVIRSFQDIGVSASFVDKASDAFGTLVGWLTKLAAVAIEADVNMLKLIGALTGGGAANGPALEGAGANMAGSLNKGFKNAQGMHSPSKVWQEFGENLTEGLGVGTDKGSRELDGAMRGLMQPPTHAANSNGKGGTTVEAGAIHVEVHASNARATAEEIRELTETAMQDALERFVLELGA